MTHADVLVRDDLCLRVPSVTGADPSASFFARPRIRRTNLFDHARPFAHVGQRTESNPFEAHFSKYGNIAGNYWSAARKRLNHRNPEALGKAGHEHGASPSVEARQLSARNAFFLQDVRSQ